MYTNVDESVWMCDVARDMDVCAECECEGVCGEECNTRAIEAECSREHHGGRDCTNQVVGRLATRPVLEVFRTKGRGIGVRTVSAVAIGTILGEYVGEIMTAEAAAARELESGKESAYVFRLKGGQWVDAERKGNVTRFINHACSPNAEVYEIAVEGLPRLMVRAKMAIKQGMEVTISYGNEYLKVIGGPCLCSQCLPKAATVEGYIGGRHKPLNTQQHKEPHLSESEVRARKEKQEGVRTAQEANTYKSRLVMHGHWVRAKPEGEELLYKCLASALL